MKQYLTLLFLFLVLISSACYPQRKTYVLWGATIIDITHKKPVVDGAIVVEGRKIGDSGRKLKVLVPAQAETIDVKGKFIMPGLIDVHTHYDKPEDLRRMLAWGVTTVNMMFESTDEAMRIQGWTQTDTAVSPQVYATAPIFSTEHGWWWGDAFPNDTSINRFPKTPDEARQQVQKVKAKGISRMKIMYDDMSWCRSPLEPMKQMDPEVMKALVNEAVKLGIYVEVHAPKLKDATEAVNAGAQALAHGIIDSRVGGDLLVTMQNEQVMYTPTFCVFKFLADVKGFMTHAMEEPLFRNSLPDKTVKEYTSEEYFKKYRERYPNYEYIQKNLTTLDDNCTNLTSNLVPVPLGTDMWALPGIAAHLELEYMQNSGVKPVDVIINATACSAEFLGLRKKVAYILPGYQADLIIMDKNPLEDVRNLRTVSMIIKKGKIFRKADILKSLE